MSDTLNDYRAAIGDNSGDLDYSADLDDANPLSDAASVAAKTARVAVLAKLQVAREATVERLAAELKTATTLLENVSKRELPRLLADLNVGLLPLANGAKVQLKKKVVASVRKEDRSVFIKWLVKQGYASLPKRKITVEFGMGAFKKAAMLLGVLKRHYKDFVVIDDESIHPGTLSAWARERQEANNEALRDGGKILTFPECLTITDLLESEIILPKGKVTSWD